MRMIDFGTEINKKLVEGRIDRIVPPNEFYCYYAGYCERQIWRSKKGLAKFPDTVLGAMQVGTILHGWLEETFGDKGKTEVAFRSHWVSFCVAGKADFVDSTHVYDFKTEKSLRWLPKDDNNQPMPRPHHIPQLQLYMHFMEYKRGVLVYIDKTNLEVKQFEIQLDPTMILEILQKYQNVLTHLGERECPFEPCGCWQCEQEKKMEKKGGEGK